MEIQIVISISCTILGFIIAFLTFSRNRDKDVRQDAYKSAEINTKLNSIGVGVDSIRVDLKSYERRITQAEKDIIRIDESSKSAHKRIDEIVKNEK